MYLRDLVQQLGGEARGEVAMPLTGVGTIEAATAAHITFLANPKYAATLANTKAGAVILAATHADVCTKPHIVAENPYAYFALTAQLFSPPVKFAAGISQHAMVHADAKISATASVAEFASVGAGAVIGDGVRIGAACVVGEGVVIGDNTVLTANVTVYHHCIIGNNVLIHAGVVIGADGFGFAPDAGRWIKIPQTGRVVIGDDCEIGANTCIDRGAIEDTVIGNGVKLDNQIQIGHNVVIGDNTVIAGCVGIAGSTHIGNNVQIGGMAAILGHLEIADGCVISPTTYVTKSITEMGTYSSGMPFMPHTAWLKNTAQLRNISELVLSVKLIKGKIK